MPKAAEGRFSARGVELVIKNGKFTISIIPSKFSYQPEVAPEEALYCPRCGRAFMEEEHQKCPCGWSGTLFSDGNA